MKLRLSDIYDLQMGKTPARDTPEYWHGSHAWASISDMHPDEKYIRHTRECITDEAINETGIKLIPKNTLLMSFKLSIGKTAITAEDLYTNEAIMAFIDKRQHEVDINFMYHLFRALNWAIGSNKAVKGVTLNKATLSDKTIELPPISKQRNIAELFDCLDEVKRIIKVLLMRNDTLVKSRFIEMFFNTTDSTKWEKAKIEDVCEHTRTGPFGSSLHHDEFVDEGIFVLGIDNAVENRFSYNRMRYITPEKYEQLKRYTVKPKDVIITIMGTVGRSAVIPDDMPTAINTKHLACLTPKQEILDSYFLSQAFQTHPEIRGQLTAQTKGAIMDGLNLTIIKNLTITVPPLSLQKEYVTFLKQAGKSKLAIRKLLEKQELLRAALMQEYFG